MAHLCRYCIFVFLFYLLLLGGYFLNAYFHLSSSAFLLTLDRTLRFPAEFSEITSFFYGPNRLFLVLVDMMISRAKQLECRSCEVDAVKKRISEKKFPKNGDTLHKDYLSQEVDSVIQLKTCMRMLNLFFDEVKACQNGISTY